MIRRTMWFVATVAALALLPAALGAQQRGSVTGTVVDQSTQTPLQGVQITVAGTTLGTISNQQGRFLIPNVPAGTQTVRAALIGYGLGAQSVTVSPGEAATVNFQLAPSAVELEGVVVSAVTGQAQRKRELGTNTASISAADLERAPLTKMADALVGRTAGVQLQGVAGTVGASQRIRIRGTNSLNLSNEPLIFVDGIQASNNTGGFAVGGQNYSRLNDINPEDIANIEILKGPAASALYGTAAANGVILISTRRGRAGAAQWRGYVEAGSSADRNPYPSNFMTVQVLDANAPLFRDDGRVNADAYTYCPNESAARGECTQDRVVSLNPFRTAGLTPFSTGNRQKYGLSVAGGGDAVTYFVSGDFDTETGVIHFNEQDRAALRANFGAQVLDNLGLNVNASYVRTRLQMNPNDNNIFSPLINGLLASPFVPTAEQRELGVPGQRSGTGFGYFLSDIEENIAHQLVDRYIVGGNTSWQPFTWLAVNSNVGLDYFSRFDNTTVQPGRLPIAATWTPGFRNAQRSNNYIWTLNTAGVSTYQLTGDLGATTTLGGHFSREQFESTFCRGVGIVEGTRSCSATSSLFEVDEDFTEVRTVGAYLQQQFSWRDRLFVAGSVRGDDNSAFGQDFGLIYYPGASISWVVSEEPFFPLSDALSNLRLRAAYGMSGQRPGMRDAVTLLDPVSATVGGQELSAIRLSRVGNPDLKPERTTEFEIGFDAGLMRDRISLEFGYFSKESQDALIARPLPPSFGLTGAEGVPTQTGQIWDNLGSVRNWGTELALNAHVLQLPAAQLNLRLSATTLRNRIEDMGGLEPIVFNRGTQQHKEGFSAGGFHAPLWQIQNPAQQRLLTRDDVVLTTDTAVFIGPSLPTNSQSLAGDLTLFRNLLTISTLFERRAGHHQVNYTEWFRCTTGFSRAGNHTGTGNCPGVADPNAPLDEQARFIAGRLGAVNPNGPPARITSLAGYIEPADFIKWRELSVTLQAPDQLARTAPALRGASITVSGRNLATWTDYTGIDPEINETGSQRFATGGDFLQGEFNTQPPLRYFTLRLNYNF